METIFSRAALYKKMSFIVGDFVNFYYVFKLVGKVIEVDEEKRQITVVNDAAQLKVALQFDSVEKIIGSQLESVQRNEKEKQLHQQVFAQQLNLIKGVGDDTLIFACKQRGLHC